MKTIALLITTYQEHTRPGKLWRAAQIALADPRISQLVLRDDSGIGTPGHNAFLENVEAISRSAPRELKITANANQKNLGVFGNKLAAIRDCECDWAQSLDSDNQLDVRALDTIFAYEWLPHVMFSPSFAEPEFDYRAKAGFKITLSNVPDFFEWRTSCCLMNTGNQFMHVPTMRSVLQKEPVENFQMSQSDYFRRGNNRADLHWRKVYDAADSFYFNSRWLMAGNETLIVPGLQYKHEVHRGSSWLAAPQEKDILPIIYALELIDRSRGQHSDYLFEASGLARHVQPPLNVPGNSKVAVLTRHIAGRVTRLYVSCEQPKVLRTLDK